MKEFNECDLDAESATAHLEKTGFEPFPSREAVKSSLFAGGDINRPCYSGGGATIFHQYIRRGLVKIVEMCCEVLMSPIDFETCDVFGYNALLAVCLAPTDTVCRSIFSAITQRWQRQREELGRMIDHVDWTIEDPNCHMFLSLAAAQRRLHIVWPLILTIPSHEWREASIFINATISPLDWESLGESRNMVTPTAGLLGPTELLNELSDRATPKVEAVRFAVARSANVCSMKPFMKRTILHHFIGHGLSACVAECMKTPHGIDFTSRDEEGKTFLHTACHLSTSERALGMLELLVSRIQRHKPNDRVDFWQPDHELCNVFQRAAQLGRLSVLCAALKDLLPDAVKLSTPKQVHPTHQRSAILKVNRVLPIEVIAEDSDWEKVETLKATSFFTRVHVSSEPVEEGMGDASPVLCKLSERQSFSMLAPLPSFKTVSCQPSTTAADAEAFSSHESVAVAVRKAFTAGQVFQWRIITNLHYHRFLFFGSVYLVTLRWSSAAGGSEGEKYVVSVHDCPLRTREDDSLMDKREEEGHVYSTMSFLLNLKHRYLIPFYGFQFTLDSDGTRCVEVFLQACEESLETLARRGGRDGLEVSAVREYTRQLLEVLSYLHAKGIVHGDVRPATMIFSRETNSIQLLYLSEKTACAASAVTTTFHGGLPSFIAPEVVQSPDLLRQCPTGASDVWAVGCTVMRLLGASPWSEPEHNPLTPANSTPRVDRPGGSSPFTDHSHLSNNSSTLHAQQPGRLRRFSGDSEWWVVKELQTNPRMPSGLPPLVSPSSSFAERMNSGPSGGDHFYPAGHHPRRVSTLSSTPRWMRHDTRRSTFGMCEEPMEVEMSRSRSHRNSGWTKILNNKHLCDFLHCCFKVDSRERRRCEQLLKHPWMTMKRNDLDYLQVLPSS